MICEYCKVLRQQELEPSIQRVDDGDELLLTAMPASLTIGDLSRDKLDLFKVLDTEILQENGAQRTFAGVCLDIERTRQVWVPQNLRVVNRSLNGIEVLLVVEGDIDSLGMPLRKAHLLAELAGWSRRRWSSLRSLRTEVGLEWRRATHDESLSLLAPYLSALGGRMGTKAVHGAHLLVRPAVQSEDGLVVVEGLERVGSRSGGLENEIVGSQTRTECLIHASADGLENVESFWSTHILIYREHTPALSERLDAVDEEREELALWWFHDLIQILTVIEREADLVTIARHELRKRNIRPVESGSSFLVSSTS